MRDLSAADVVTGWGADPASLLVIAVVAVLYTIGVRRLAARGRRWSPARSLAMAGALALGVIATQSGVGRYEYDRFWVHMVQHMLLGMAVPLLVVLSAPLTLALQSAHRATRRTLRLTLRTRTAFVVGHPVTAWCTFGGGLAILYLTSLLDLSARNNVVHMAIHAHIVLSGVLFFAVFVGIDPLPAQPGFPTRLLALLVAVPFHAVVGLALFASQHPVAPEAYPDLADQRLAAGLFWGLGEVFTAIIAAIVMRQWWVSEKRAEQREAWADARLAQTAAADVTAPG